MPETEKPPLLHYQRQLELILLLNPAMCRHKCAIDAVQAPYPFKISISKDMVKTVNNVRERLC